MLTLFMSVAALMLGVAILNFGNGLFGTFLSLRMNLEAFPTEVTGLVMSAYYAGFVVGAYRCDRIINRVGHIRAFAAFAAAVSAVALVAAFFVSPSVWGVMRATLGFCLAGVFMVTESWLNMRATASTRGRLFSMYMMVSYLATGGGQLLLGLRDPRSQDFFMIAALSYSFSLIPLALTSAETPAPVASSKLDLSALYRISPLGVLTCLGAGLVVSSFYGMGAVFAQEAGFTVSEVSYFMGAAIFGGLALQWPVGRLSDRYDRRMVIFAVAVLTAVPSLGLATIAGTDKALVIGLACLYGGFSFTLYPLAVAHANDFVAAKDAVKASGGLLLSWGIGASCGPLAAAAMMGRLGPRGLFLFVAAVTVALALFTLWRMTQRPTVPAEQKERFAPLSAHTPVGAEAARSTAPAEPEPIG